MPNAKKAKSPFLRGSFFAGSAKKEKKSDAAARPAASSGGAASVPSDDQRGRSAGRAPLSTTTPGELGTQDSSHPGARTSVHGVPAYTQAVPRKWKVRHPRRSHHGVASRFRRVLRRKGRTVAPEYANVFLILGLCDGELIQNGYVCLRAADVTESGVEGVSQLTGYPFLRHCILVNKKTRRTKQPKTYYTVLGTGQYTAIVNASTQVDGMAPLEVCVLRRSGGPQLEKKRSSHRSSIVGSVVGTLRSSARELGLVSSG
ncbi:hypothetical protein BESB_010850 [Besnoitia besnoiti]|uniref:Uncharacterized protein n=1 Tax=Besnoitia besnoiti TaxID=94643 RepID=A0A2A9MQT9_BESBE|nr:hypothetical protein BESB_010850 [Besnoitia besnoiti]PFH38743.1 hypothetical protein BESB_010850 [Besnoitia besnoiti]